MNPNSHDRTTAHNKLRDEILAYLNSLPGADFEPSPPGSRTGKHDITGVLRGRYVSIDVKTGNAKPTKLQLYEGRRKLAAGAVVGYVRSLNDVKSLLSKNNLETEG